MARAARVGHLANHAVSGSAARGARCFLRGLGLLRHPRLRPFVAIPLAVNCLVFAAALYHAIAWTNAASAEWAAALPAWLAWLDWLWLLAVPALALLTAYLSSALALFVAAPFHGLLAEKAEEVITGETVAGTESIAAAFAQFPRAAGRELRKYAYYLPLLLAVFALS